MPDQVVGNKHKSWLLIGGFVASVFVVVLAIALLLGAGPLGIVAALAVAGAKGFAAYRTSDAVALWVSRARPAPEYSYARYHNLVEGLCVASGLPKPRLYVIEDPAPNAFATGRNPRNAALAVTTGLLEKLNRVELEGVLAHELSHVKNHDILVSTLAVTMVGMVTVVADVCVRMTWWGMGRSSHRDFDRRQGGEHGGPRMVVAWFGFGLLALAPLVARVMRLTVNQGRETLADMSAIQMTKYPPGLIGALEKLRESSPVVASTSHATSHLWFGEPSAQTPDEGELSGINRRFATHPPLEERIALLREI